MKIDGKEIKVYTLKVASNDPVFPSKCVFFVWIVCYVHFFYIFDKFSVTQDPLCTSFGYAVFLSTGACVPVGFVVDGG